MSTRKEGPPSPSVPLRQLDQCLADLDRIGAALPAAHLAPAIDRLHDQFNLEEDSSETDLSSAPAIGWRARDVTGNRHRGSPDLPGSVWGWFEMAGYRGESDRFRHPAPAPPSGPPAYDGQSIGNGRSNALSRPAIPLRHVPGDQPLAVHSGREQARRLIAAANELLALAAELEQAGPGPAGADGLPAAEPAPEDERRWLRHARQTYRRRRSRTLFFEDTLFGEPAWDLLLDLFIAAKERKRVPVTSACIGAAVPTTTALRWLTILEERGLVLREADPADARRIFVRLTAEAYARMVAYFVRAAAGETDEESAAR